jgi:hypothetical protein
LPSPDEIKTLEGAALATPRETMTPAEIRVAAAQALGRLSQPQIATSHPLEGEESLARRRQDQQAKDL